MSKKLYSFVLARYATDGSTQLVLTYNDIAYTYDVTTGGQLAMNGNILTGLDSTSVFTDPAGGTVTLGELLSGWNSDSDSVLLLLRLNEGAQGVYEIGKDDYITLPFSTTEPIEIAIGDYVDMALVLDTAQGKQFAKRYEVCTPPKPTYNTSTGGYDYELRLDAYYMKWKNKIFRYIAGNVAVGEEAQGEAAWSLTADLATHMAVLLRNLTSLGYTYGGTEFTYGTSNYDQDLTKARLVSYSETNIIDALSLIAETFECEWWIEDNFILFGKCEHSDLVQVQIGVEAEAMSRSDSEGTFATRLYAFGAARNLQSNYRQTDDELLLNGVVQRRLMLPTTVPYVDAWRYDSAGEKIYTTAYKDGTWGTKVYVGESGYDDLDGEPHLCGFRVIVTTDSEGKITLTRQYVSEDDYAACIPMTVEETIEGVISTDEIYPRTDDSVTQVSKYYKMFDPSVEGDSGTLVYDDIDPAFAGQTFDPDTWQGTGAQYLEVYYRVKSKFFNEKFDVDYVLPGETLSLTFNSGRLNGMDFEVMFLGASGDTKVEYTSPDGTQWFELVATTSYGTQLPNDILYPEVGDEFVLYNWQYINSDGTLLPKAQEMIDAAEQELLAYAIEYLWDTMVDDGVYTTELNPSYVYADGSQSAYIQRTFAVGQRILLVNDALFTIPRESRVVGYTINIDIPYDHPTYKIGESVQYSRIGAVESKVNELTYSGKSYTSVSSSGGSSFYLIKTNDSVSPSDANAFSALRSLITFLRKDADDEAAGNIIFDKDISVGRVATMIGRAVTIDGVQFGEVFETGLLGVGGMIDGNGVGELDALTLRKWLEVPELRYNRVTVMTGVTWQTVGGGIIESVVIDTDEDGNEQNSGTITLKLEEGEYGAVAVDDLCMGIFHDFDTQYVNDDYNEDQHNGNFHFAGFGTVYFRITEIVDESTNGVFKYVLRGVSERWTQQHHPRAFMNFACYANVTNAERQACKYSTTDYEIRLRNMNDWEYGQANYYYIEGDLSGFTIDGTQLAGNGIYIGNGYFSGMLQQISNAPYELSVDITDGDTLMEEGSTCTIVCSVTKAFEDVTTQVDPWQVERETSDSAADEKWNAAHNDFRGTLIVSYDELFETDTSVLLRFYATVGTTTVTASIILRAYAEGQDAVVVLPTCSNVVFGEGVVMDDDSLEVYAYRGTEQIVLTRSNVTLGSVPSGVTVNCGESALHGSICFAFIRDSVDTDVSGTMDYTVTIDGVDYALTCGVYSVFDGEDGADGADGKDGADGRDGTDALLPTMDGGWEIVFSPNYNSVSPTLHLFTGTTELAATLYSVAISTQNPAQDVYVMIYPAGGLNNKNYLLIQRTNPLTPVENCTFDVTFTFGAAVLTQTVTITSVADGEQGEQGEPGKDGADGKDGEDAVYYELVLSSDTLEYNAFANAFAPDTITIQVRKIVGDTREFVNFQGRIYFYYSETGSVTQTFSDRSSYTFTPIISQKTASGSTRYYERYTIYVYPTENTAATLEKTIYPTTTYLPRVRVWDDCNDGTAFCQGKLGEQFRDIVIHGTNAYFVCLTSHEKSSDKEPKQGEATAYWQQMSYFDFVATNLILADTAKINNLYADDVFIVGENGGGDTAIWINPAFEGMKINKVSNLTSTDRAEQGYDDWANPTSWFHAGSIPDIGIYGTGQNVTSQLLGKYSSWGAPVGGYSYLTNTLIASQKVTIGSSTTGTVTISSVTLTLKEGSYDDTPDETVIPPDYSSATLVLVMSSNVNYTSYDVIQTKSLSCQNSTSPTTTLGGISTTITKAGTYYCGILLTANFLSGASLSVDKAMSLSYTTIVSGYTSQYTAEGIFIGLNSNNYMRLATKDSATQYTLLANNCGIDLTQQGAMQVVAGNAMPLGGCLAVVSVSVSNSKATFKGWAFDGSSLSVQYYDTGVYRVFFPSSWSSALGTYSSDKVAVSTSYQAHGRIINISVQRGSYGGYWGYLNIHVTESGTYVDVPFVIRADYVSYQTTSDALSPSTSTITPLSIAMDADSIASEGDNTEKE